MQQVLMETLDFTINFFEENNIRYYACGGTCLGAVRHKSFIPWDDDVDLFVPYEDCVKLLELKDRLDGTGYYIVTPETRGYYLPFPKICKCDTTIWERYDYPFVMGVYIDVFPLYLTNIDDYKDINKLHKSFLKAAERFQFANQNYPFWRFVDNVRHFHLRGFLRNIKWKYDSFNVEKFRDTYKKIESSLNVVDGTKYVSYTSDKYSTEVLNKDWFDDYCEMPFGNLMIRLPQNYDAYLTYIYGDYMKLPPENERISVHGKYYINFKEGLTLNEVRKRISKGEKCVL